jgi:tetratricopeptide (TPR) repeat protein
MTEVEPGGDIDYMLRAYPNHHRALFSMGRLSKQSGRLRPAGVSYRAECYYLRAIHFAPDDGVVKMLYGIYLSYWDKLDESLTFYEEAVRIMPDSAEAHYNLGLLLVRLDKLDRAAEAASTAYKLGYPLSGLKRQLARRGVQVAE